MRTLLTAGDYPMSLLQFNHYEAFYPWSAHFISSVCNYRHLHVIRSDAWRHCECNAGMGASYFVTEQEERLKIFSLKRNLANSVAVTGIIKL